MKISLNWMQLFTSAQFNALSSPLRDIAHMYSIHTAEIEDVRKIEPIDKVVVGQVMSTKKHPDSTKLWICEVHVGNTPAGEKIVEVILTGAQNVTVGMFVPVAVVGAKLAPDFEISERKMAGMLSRGMLCGPNEIGLLEQDTGGIQDLEEITSRGELEIHIGDSVFSLTTTIPGITEKTHTIPVVDAIFEIDNKNITNRPDLFGIYGHAREFAALTQEVFTPIVSSLPTNLPVFPVQIDTPYVLSYSIAQLEGIHVCKAPFGIRMLLERSGHSTHDGVVDMTNYVMMECGQPIHAFDADIIDGGIIVRQAKIGETLVALDGKEYTLTPEDIVIADKSKILAIAGVMGGMQSGISESTKNICIESAVFDPVKIRLTAQRLGLRSDASTRFEKSLDPHFSTTVLARACEVLEFSRVGGKISASSKYIAPTVANALTIDISLSFIQSRLGIKIDAPSVIKYLTSLGFEIAITGDESFRVLVPSHRATKDISIPEDIVEEVARLIGFDKIPEFPMNDNLEIVTSSGHPEFRALLQEYFRGADMFEAYNYSFSNEEKDEMAGILEHETAIKIRNAVSAEYTCMRRSLAPLLLQAIYTNLKQIDSISFFEIAKIHRKDSGGKFEEKKMFGGVFSEMNTKDIRNLLDGLLSRLSIEGAHIESGTNLPFLHPMVSSSYVLDGKTCIRFGKVHPKIAMNFEIPDTTWYFECEYQVLFEKHMSDIASGKQTYVEPNKYPTITRELNFVMDTKQVTNTIGDILYSVDPRIQEVQVIDVFTHAEKVGKDKKSVTFRFSIVDRNKTITDDEALSLQKTCIDSVAKAGYPLRTI